MADNGASDSPVHAADRLRAVIEKNQKAMEQQTAIMIELSQVMVGLTRVGIFLAGLSIIPVIRDPIIPFIMEFWHWLRPAG